jgi:chromosome segregation ATPase
MRERVPLMVDKHCGRLRWDFVQRLERSRIALERQLDERLDASVESLRLGLRRASKEQARGRREMASTQAEAAEARAALDALDETMGELAGRARDLARAMPKEDPVRA